MKKSKSILIRAGLYVYCFHAGASTYFPLINFKGNFGLGDIFFLVSALLIIWERLMYQKKVKIEWWQYALTPLFLGFISLFSWTFASIFRTNFFLIEAWGYISRWFVYFIVLLFIPLIIQNYRDLTECIFFLFLGLISNMLWSWYLWKKCPMYLHAVPKMHVIVNGQVLVGRNVIGFFSCFAICIIFSILFFKGSKKLWKLISLMLTPVVCFIAFSTFSKGTWVVSFFSILFVLFLAKKYLRLKIYKFLVFTLIIVLGLFLYLSINQKALNKLSSYINDYNIAILDPIKRADFSLNMRWLYAVSGFKIMLYNPILGIGPQAYRVADGYYSNTYGSTDPHNSFAWIGAELGLIAMFVYAIYFLYFLPKILFKCGRYSFNHPNFLGLFFLILTSFWFVFLSYSFLTGLTISTKIFWGTSGLILALNNILNKELKYHQLKAF